MRAPTSAELTRLARTIAHRVGRFLERRGLLERDADDCMDAGGRATHGAVAENSHLAVDAVDEDPMTQLLGHSINYRIAAGPQAGRNECKQLERRASLSWAQRLKLVFNIDIETCREYGCAVKVIACIEDPWIIRNILTHLGNKGARRQIGLFPEGRSPPAGLFG